MIQPHDNERIEALKDRLGLPTKIGVVRAGMDLLEQEAERRERVQRWRRAAARVAATSREINAEFRRRSRMRRA